MTIIEHNGIAGKICCKCEEWKVVEEFHRFHLSSDGFKARCKSCANKAVREKRASNPEESRLKAQAYIASRREESNQYQRTWRDKNRDKVRESTRRYQKTHRELLRERYRQARVANIEHHRAIGRRAYHNNVEKRRAYNRNYRKSHPEKMRAQVRTRRNRKYQAEGSHTEAQWEELKALYNYTCLRCGQREPTITLTRDHVVPLAQGGSDWISNIQPLCPTCNSSKNNRTIDYRH